VRSHAKAPTAGSTRHKATVALAALAALCATLLAAAPAFAATVTDRTLLFSFDGSDGTAGKIQQGRAMAVDESSGVVYVVDGAKRTVDKFNANGEAIPFASIGGSSLSGADTPQGAFAFVNGRAAIAVADHGPNLGNIYVNGSGGEVSAFNSAGEFLWQLPPDTLNGGCGVAVDTAGHLWGSDREASGSGPRVREFASTGSPPAELSSFTLPADPCRLDLDTSGNVYLQRQTGGGSFNVQKYVGGAFDSILDSASTSGVAVDQSSPAGHIFTQHFGDFNEYDSTGSLIGTFGANVGFSAQGIGYNPSLDRVYFVAFDGGVLVFGPSVTGTTPDPVTEAPTEVGVAKAKFHGKVNPQSVPNSYYFEWKKGTGSTWTELSVGSKTSPPQTLPEDSSEHAVELAVNSLRGNTTYQVRLVGENTANGLRTWSSPVTFTTSQAASSPAVTIAAPSGVTANAATVSGTIDPKGDTADWRVQLSTAASCTSGFANQAGQTIAEGSESPVPVSLNLTGLLPNQHYCARISATNSFGTTTSAVQEFETDPVIPSQVFTAFVAPRLDTSVRLNGYANPEGANSVHPLTYSFEYSGDGGATWTALPEQEYTGGAREQIVLGQELTGLTPSTTYSYRFNAENDAGEAPQGGVKTFTTRTSAEVLAPDRGVELVNSPDKGNQNVNSVIEAGGGALPMLPDGEVALWNVLGGAPGGTASARNAFIAERGAGGWSSRSLVPPAEEQVGEGDFLYEGQKVTPDFRHFVFSAGESNAFGSVPHTLVRLDRNQHQEALATFEGFARGDKGEISDDGAHVLVINPDNKQLEDVGGATPEIVSIMPDGAPSACGLNTEGHSFAGGGQNPVGTGANWRSGYRLIDVEDAARVYFQVRPNGSCNGNYALYERNRETEETTLIDLGAVSGSEFIRATPDGRHAYFVTASQLDPADANSGKDVYRWDEGSGESSCLTCVVANADVSLTVMVSDDFSHIYFQSIQQLVPGMGTAGQQSTYVLSDGQIRFVGGRGMAPLRQNEPLLSADGNVMIFKNSQGSAATLSSDKVAVCGESDCAQLYRYDDRERSIECLSCDHAGETSWEMGSGVLNGSQHISSDGATIAFVTTEALLAEDVNNTADVYEWRNGAVHLVTNGVTEFQKGKAAPQVKAVGEGGSSILFIVADPGLTGFELDGLSNLYMARIGGGFEVPPPPTHCSEEACQGPLEAPPAEAKSTSAHFNGPGNVNEGRAKPRCAKGKVRRRGRCVRKQKRPRKQKRSHHKRASHANQGRTK
jgi:hypothetical protein